MIKIHPVAITPPSTRLNIQMTDHYTRTALFMERNS